MVVLGIDAHKRTHMVVAVDEVGRQLGVRVTTSAPAAAHLDLVRWAGQFGPGRQWAVEDCRHLSRRLERDLPAAGETIVRVPPKLMAKCRDSARTYGKSDPIDALAVARAALREPGLPSARLDGPERELRLLVDHREDLVAERTRAMNRLRWHLRGLDPDWDPAPRALTSRKTITAITARLAGMDGLVARLATDLAARIAALTAEASALEKEIAALTRQLNCAIHRIAVTQIRCHPDAQAYLKHRIAAGDTKTEAPRALKRRLSDIVYRALLADGTTLPVSQAA